MNPIKILWVSAEASPYVKVGGLGDVSGALPVALRREGIDIRRCLPHYEKISGDFTREAEVVVSTASCKETVIVRTGYLDEVPTWLFDCAHAFGRPEVYGYADDAERFSLFCLAVCEWLKTSDFQPDILHLHDWHTTPLVILLRENKELPQAMQQIKVLLTIHSMEYQGLADRSLLGYLSLPDTLFTVELLEHYGMINLLKGGILYADVINTVSPTHARELLKPGYGFGLEDVLAKRRSVFSGILNGIDTKQWDPSNAAPYIKSYSSENLAPKRQNKRALMKQCGFSSPRQPLLGFVGRLVESKGVRLILGALPQLVAEGASFVFLGTGELALEQALWSLHEEFPEQVHVTIGFDEAFARRIYAGSDIFLMPSLHEPCGIAQLIAMRYGALPVVRKTGGLIDTVQTDDIEAATGFAFFEPTVIAFKRAVSRAIQLWRESPEIWLRMQRCAMTQSYAWKESGRLYTQLYLNMISRGEQK